jgi:ribosomal protein S18 acetylase RimI-like enzyme
MKTELKLAYDAPQTVRTLFLEYTDDLLRQKPDFAGYLAQQNYEAELSDLRHKYGPPEGRLYILWADSQAAGCIALKKLDGKSCELKRLYVRPAYRRQHFARLLVQRILDDARAIGYEKILLDTFPFLTSAIALYRSAGFYDIPSYNGTPMTELIYLCRDL